MPRIKRHPSLCGYRTAGRNIERAEWARSAMDAYSRAKGERGGDWEDSIRDLMQDLMHLLAQDEDYCNEDPRETLQRMLDVASRDFENEFTGRDE